MIDPDSHIALITHAIQLAIAPVFLLTAIGTIINALAGRLSRAVDRRRQIEDELIPALKGEDAEVRVNLDTELGILARRILAVIRAIALAVISALLVCLLIGTAFAQEDAESAKMQWRKVADQLRPTVQKLATLMDDAEADVLAYTAFPKEHWTKIYSTNGLERLNGEIKRRTEVVGIFPNEEAIKRLVGAILLEQNDEWAVQRSRFMTLESLAALSDDPIVKLPAVAA